MHRETRRRLIGLSGLLAVSTLFTLGFMTTVAHFVGKAELRSDSETSYLTRTGQHCLAHVPEVDLEPGPAWRSEWVRLSEADCKPGRWLYQFRERGQNLADYQGGEPNVPSEEAWLGIAQLGEFHDDDSTGLLEPVREFLGLYFQREVVLGARLDLPRAAFHEEKGLFGQYDAEKVLEHLVGTCPAEAAACVAITDRDLFVDKLQYVFGLGHFSKRVGVVSTYRLWEDRRNQVTDRREAVRKPEPLRRALKVAVHEVAHEFSLAHCVHYRDCVMAGTNSLEESDAGRLTLCPLDHEKLAWNLGFQPHRRFSELSDWAERNGLYPEARYWERMASDYPAYENAAGGGL